MTKRLDKILFFVVLTLLVGALLAPTLKHYNFDNLAHYLYRFFKLLCHQRPERSIFLFGKNYLYSKHFLIKKGYIESTLYGNSAFLGNSLLGYKIAVCVRDLGLYLGLISSGILVIWLQDYIGLLKVKVRKDKVLFSKTLKFLIIAGILPMVIDGSIQLIAFLLNFKHPFYQSHNLLRITTGYLFGLSFGSWAFNVLKYN